MVSAVRAFDCAPEAVFEAVADGWLYPAWVVGACRMRDVDDDWPAVGSGLHHSIGVWPVVVNDETSVSVWDPPRRVEFHARVRPFAEAHIVLEVKPRGSGCVVRISYDVIGAAAVVPRPVLDLVMKPRNVEMLRRLSHLAVGRSRAAQRRSAAA
jgi:hypothetical protein